MIEVKNLWKLFVRRVKLVIGTAQNLDIAEESWAKALEIIESIPDLSDELRHVDRAGGKKTFTLDGGRRWKVATPSRKGGRGLSGDDVNLDELREHHTWDSWAAVTKTTLARAMAQIWGFSNAGDDKSVVLNTLLGQGRALARQDVPEDPSVGLFEWSAPDDVTCTCGRRDPDPDDPDAEPVPHAASCRIQDRSAWAQANPSLGYTITEEALASALSTDPTAVFRTECLCQRVPTLVKQWRVIPEADWNALTDHRPQMPERLAFGVQVDYRRRCTAIAAAGFRPDGTILGTLVAYQPGTDWVVRRLVELRDKHRPIAIAAQDKGPTGSLIDDMARVGILPPADKDRPGRGDLAVPWADDVADAFGKFLDAVNQGRFFHTDDVPLNLAVADADTRQLSGALAWEFKGKTDCSPLIAQTLACWALLTRDALVVDSFEPSAVWL